MSLLRFLFLHPPGPVSIAGLLCFGVLVWFAGPMLSVAGHQPLASVGARIAIILCAPLFALLIKHGMWRRGQAENLRFIESLLAVSTDAGDTRAPDGRKVLSRQAAFEYLALAGNPLLAREKPWFFVLGGRGCGKSSIVRNLAVMPNHYVGSGISREYDWWTNETGAPLLEIGISGVCESESDGAAQSRDERARLLRDVVQGSDWRQFLDAVSQGRPEQPVNGLLLVVSLAELLRHDAAGLAERAVALRARLDDLQQRLAARVPCYLVLTKADAISGFAEFFAGLSPDEHNQTWGVTFGLPGTAAIKKPPSATQVTVELRRLIDNLDQPRLRRLAGERDLARRFMVFMFPFRFAQTAERVAAFVSELGVRAPAAQPLILRGIYFTSSLSSGNEKVAKSFFVPGIFKRVMLREAGLVRSTRLVAGIKRHFARWFYPLLSFSMVAMIAFFALALYLMQQKTAEAEQALRTFQTQIAAHAEGSGPDEQTLVSALDALRSAQRMTAEPPWPLAALGLYQGRELADAGLRAYRRALDAFLFPHVQATMEAHLQAPWMAPKSLRELLRLYRMLGDAGPLEPQQIKDWIARNMMAGQGAGSEQQHPLQPHVDMLFRPGSAPRELKQSLIDAVSARLEKAGA